MTGSTVAGEDPRRHAVREPGSGRFTRKPADPPGEQTAAAPPGKVRETRAGSAAAPKSTRNAPGGKDHPAPGVTDTPPAAPLPLRLYREGLSALRRRS